MWNYRKLKSEEEASSLTSDWLPGSGSCAPAAPPPPAWSAPPPAAAASPASAAACWPGWSPAAAPPSPAAAAWSPGRGPPRPGPTSSHCPAVQAGAGCSAPCEDGTTGSVSGASSSTPGAAAGTVRRFIATGNTKLELENTCLRAGADCGCLLSHFYLTINKSVTPSNVASSSEQISVLS